MNTKHEHFKHELAMREKAAKIFSRNFGASSVGEVPPIDQSLLNQLRTLLQGTDESLLMACSQRGLLPFNVVDAIDTAIYLTFTMAAARAAHEATGVPASVLIAEARCQTLHFFHYFGFRWPSPSTENDIFGTGKSYATLHVAFAKRAQSLKSEKRFHPVMAAAHDPEQYLIQVERWSAPKYGTRLMEEIRSNQLTSLDSIHIPIL